MRWKSTRSSIFFIIFSWYWPFKDELKGRIKIKLEPLKFSTTIENDFDMQLESKRTVVKYHLKIQIREPIQDKEYKIISKPVFTITKTFPSFKGSTQSESYNHPLSRADEKQETSKKPEQAKPKPSPPKQQPKDSKPKEVKPDQSSVKPSAEAPQQKKIDPSEFSEAELKDPDDINSLNTLKVLEYKLKIVDEKIEKVEGRIPSNLRQQKLKLKCKKNTLEQAMGDSISIDGYLTLIVKQYEKDQKLATYFGQIGEKEKQQIVLQRLPLLKAELDEGLKFAKQQK